MEHKMSEHDSSILLNVSYLFTTRSSEAVLVWLTKKLTPLQSELILQASLWLAFQHYITEENYE